MNKDFNGEENWEELTKKYDCITLTDEQFEQVIEDLMEGDTVDLYNPQDIDKIVKQVECLFGEKITVTDTGEGWSLKKD